MIKLFYHFILVTLLLSISTFRYFYLITSSSSTTSSTTRDYMSDTTDKASKEKKDYKERIKKTFTLEDKILLCDIISTSSKGLLRLTKDDDRFPHYTTLRKWVRDDPVFRDYYREAKSDQADFLVDQMRELADKCEERRDAIEKCKLQIDARKFAAAAGKPRLYSQDAKYAVDVAKTPAAPALDFSKLDVAELALLRKLYEKAGSDAAEHIRH